MNANWICPYCGGTSYRFSSSRNALVCDVCKNIVQSETERAEQNEYERILGIAKQHLQVGNWDEAKRLLRPFCSSRPTEKMLYLMLLVAVTKNFTDYLMNDEDALEEAGLYWEKLQYLKCVNAAMVEYAQRRDQYIAERKSAFFSKSGIFCGISLFLWILGGCLCQAESGVGVVFILLAIISSYLTVKYIKKVSPWSNITRINADNKDGNPFRK